MWLSTREDRGVSEEDNWAEVRQHENLTCMFIDYELRNWSRETWTWQGDLPGQALTILHQHAVQGNGRIRGPDWFSDVCRAEIAGAFRCGRHTHGARPKTSRKVTATSRLWVEGNEVGGLQAIFPKYKRRCRDSLLPPRFTCAIRWIPGGCFSC